MKSQDDLMSPQDDVDICILSNSPPSGKPATVQLDFESLPQRGGNDVGKEERGGKVS